MKTCAPAESLNDYLAKQKARVAEYAARGEDTPEKLEWFRKGIARRREEFGWTLDDCAEIALKSY